jgi:soluble lytic murein transglycosylase-like protein
MRWRRTWWIVVAMALAVLPTAVVLTIIRIVPQHRERIVTPKPEAPPDLEKLRSTFASGVDALRRRDGQAAVRIFSSFRFGGRAAEEYRLYFLAVGNQLSADRGAARIALARLWSRTPRLVFWQEGAFTLGSLYAASGDFRHAADIYSQLAARSDVSPIAGNARWQTVGSRFAAGDIASVLTAARHIAIKNPRSPQVEAAIAIVRSLTGIGPGQAIAVTPAERLERGVSLMRDGDPQHALDELTALQAANVVPGYLKQAVELNRGLALNQLRRFDESNKVLEPLVSRSFHVAIPAIYTAAKNYRTLAASINPVINKTIIVRQQVGTVRVKGKGKKKPEVRPRYANVRRKVQLIDLAKKAQKESYERLSIERLRDLLSLPLADEVRVEVLNVLIGIAEARNQDGYERELVLELARVDPGQEAGLQHFWDRTWSAYSSGDYNGARDLLVFVRETYRNPNVKRQAQYWYARTIEHLGQKEEAGAIYRSLAAAPYADLYVLHATARGAPRQEPSTNPLKVKRPDWRDMAERNMPKELRLAYELTALTDFNDARLEIQKNLSRANQPFADALLADLYNSSGEMLLMTRSLRRAFPQLATVEQDSVPPYFLQMYYPVKYVDTIIKYAKQNRLDPYLVMGLIHQESFFSPLARSPVGATGLMQLMPPTARELARRLGGSANVENPEVNIRLGTSYFRQLVNMFGGAVPLAVASYNAGQGNVLHWRRAAPHKPMDEFLESIPFPETRNYVKRVTMLSASYRRITL